MGTIFAGAAIMSKIKSMYGKRLSEENYRELLRKNSVAEIAGYLKESTHYRQVMITVQESMVHRGQLENILRSENYGKYERLLRYDRKRNSFYNYHLLSIEIREVLRAIRFIHLKKDEEYLSALPVYLVNKLDVNLIELVKATTLRQLMTATMRTEYRGIITGCINADRTEIDVVRCERELMAWYYKQLDKLITENYRGSDRKELMELFGIQFELVNIATIYRMKKYFDMPSEEIRARLIAIKGKLSKKTMNKLLELGTGERFLELLEQTTYGRYITEDFIYIEHTARIIEYRLMKKMMTFTTNAQTAFAAYMALSQLEVDNIVAIIEGIRYKLSPDEVEKMLIGVGV